MGIESGLFDPQRVAVVGATERDGAVGRAVMENLVDDFDGEVVPVNPNADSVFGRRSRDRIGETDADLAVVVVPAPEAVDVVAAAGDAGIKNVVVISAGFSETGSEGTAREEALVEAADRHDINVVGPNCLGILSTPTGLNATFSPRNARPGNISFMSQSGALVTAVLDWAADRGIGFNDVVSLGNKAVLDETDFVDTWGEDDDTDVVLGYLEDIQNGASFVDAAATATESTPVAVLKSGRTDAGAQAASSHTGAVTGSEVAYEAAFEKAGVLPVASTEELFDVGAMLAGQPLPETDATAVVTNAGGPGVMAADAVGEATLALASLSGTTRDRLREVLPDAASARNPVDVIGDADAERFADALDVVLEDEGVGSAVVIACPTAVLEFEELADVVASVRHRREEPIAVCLMAGSDTDAAREHLAAADIPTYFDPSRAVRGLDGLARYRAVRQDDRGEPTDFDVDRERARNILASVEDRPDNRLGIEAMGLLDAYGIPTLDSEIVESPAAASDAAAAIDGDVVMKIVSPDILHKTDIGGVEVGVAAAEAADIYETLVARARTRQPDARILGVQVQAMADTDAGVETIVGATRDPQFGPLVVFGLGGIFVEVLEDTTATLAPLSEQEAEAMLDDINAAPLLRGARGRDPVDEAAVVETIQRLSQLVSDFPAILELDINPLVATPDGVAAVDIQLTVDPANL